MISVADALACVLEATPRLGEERVALPEALGRVAARDVVSTREVPAAANSAMDGFAVRHADLAGGTALRIVATLPAGSVPEVPVDPGTAVKIFTGSVVPPGADTVVRVEDTEERDGAVRVGRAPARGANIRDAGEDVRPGQIVLTAGQVIGPADIGVLASVGRATVAVAQRPRVAVVATGSELVEVDETPGPGQVVNSNAYALAAAIREAGGEPLVLPIVPDRPDAIRASLEAGLGADVLLSSGGVSVGELDLVKDTLDALGVERLFWKVAQKPGRPLAFGRRGRRLVFGLPGNPVSALVCFVVYVRPALRRLQGDPRPHLPIVQARLATGQRTTAGLTEFVRVRLEESSEGWTASPMASQSSGVLSALSAAAGLLVAPADVTELGAGAVYPVIAPAATGLCRARGPA